MKILKQFSNNIHILVLASSVLSLLCFGILGFGRRGESGFDGAYLYAAGRVWLEGKNPYIQGQLLQSVAGLPGVPQGNSYFLGDFFAYPPSAALFSIPLGLLSYPNSKIALILLNLLAILGIIFATFYTIETSYQPNRNYCFKGARWIMTAVIIGNPFTTHVVWMGQTTIIALSLTMLAWISSIKKQWIWSGIFLGLASFKPQICLLLVLWFVLQRYWKTLAMAFGTGMAISMYPFASQGLVTTIQSWYSSLQGYKSSSFNAVNIQNNHVVGLESFLHTAGIPSPNLSVFGILLVFGLWIFRNRINRLDLIGILMATTLTFVHARDYDYVCLIPVLTSLLIYCAGNIYLSVISACLTLALFFPQRLIRIFEIPIANQWRTVIIFVYLLMLIYLSFRQKFNSYHQEV